MDAAATCRLRSSCNSQSTFCHQSLVASLSTCYIHVTSGHPAKLQRQSGRAHKASFVCLAKMRQTGVHTGILKKCKMLNRQGDSPGQSRVNLDKPLQAADLDRPVLKVVVNEASVVLKPQEASDVPIEYSARYTAPSPCTGCNNSCQKETAEAPVILPQCSLVFCAATSCSIGLAWKLQQIVVHRTSSTITWRLVGWGHTAWPSLHSAL